MSFGDVLLSESQVRTGPDGGDLSPGAGGWPTIRYFNKATGYDGHAYDKKTDKAMCDELGDEEMMEAYVTDIGGATLCAVRPRTPTHPKHCPKPGANNVTWYGCRLRTARAATTRRRASSRSGSRRVRTTSPRRRSGWRR